jgi:hypothetical protein
VRNSKRLNARAVDPIKVPYERQHFGEFANSVSLAALNTRVIARQAQYSFERSSQITKVARANRMSKVATAKLPSLIHPSPACVFSIKVRKVGTSFSSQ